MNSTIVSNNPSSLHSPLHTSVLVNEVVKWLNPKPGGLYLDATLGAGGHSRAILEHEPRARVIALDWDLDVINRISPELEATFGDRLHIIWGNFAQLRQLLNKDGIKQLDGIIADFGTSQFQLKEQDGFSFSRTSPLDMRMSKAHSRLTVAHVVNRYSEKQLADIIYEFGEEPAARAIARSIIYHRSQAPITTTTQFARIIEAAIAHRKKGNRNKHIHPATRTFQALRMYTNNELEHIKSFLSASVDFLVPEAPLLCISFHSLEDRLVKEYMRDHPKRLELVSSKPIIPTATEIERNPSSRSAKLRIARAIPQ